MKDIVAWFIVKVINFAHPGRHSTRWRKINDLGKPLTAVAIGATVFLFVAVSVAYVAR